MEVISSLKLKRKNSPRLCISRYQPQGGAVGLFIYLFVYYNESHRCHGFPFLWSWWLPPRRSMGIWKGILVKMEGSWGPPLVILNLNGCWGKWDQGNLAQINPKSSLSLPWSKGEGSFKSAFLVYLFFKNQTKSDALIREKSLLLLLLLCRPPPFSSSFFLPLFSC